MGGFELFIRRPVLATVMSILLVLVGLVSFQNLTIREYPNIDEPVVSVTTTYKGASAEIVESQVSQVLENSIAGIAGIETITSSSRAERSTISIRFRLGVDPDDAASDVRDRVSRVRGRLPDEIEEPVIAKVEADAQPIMFLAFTSTRHSPLEISDYADRFVKDRLQNLPGVAEVRIFGERRYAMRVWLDRARLAGYGLTVQDVENALRAQNADIPSGRLESRDREFTVLSKTSLSTPEEFRQVIVKEAPGILVRMGDVAKVEVGAADERRATRVNGQNAVSMGVVKQATANPLEVSKEVRAALPEIEADLPEGMKVIPAYDTSIFIDRSIDAVFTTIAEAVILVIAVIFLFLGTMRATLVPVVTIPVSLIGAFALMDLFGFSINTLTLLAMVLAIGLVVDDAIVVLENIHRHIEEGMKPIKAAITGTREIGFAVIAMTLTLVAVFAPVAFSPGRTGKLFTEFALTLAGAVLVSGFVALTLSPMMCARLLVHKERPNLLVRAIEAVLRGMTGLYAAVLRLILRLRVVVVVAALLVGGYSAILFGVLKKELAPVEDRGTIIAVGLAPEGATIDYVSRYAQRFEGILKDIPEVASYFVIGGFPNINQAITFARLKPWEERERKQQEIIAEIQPRITRNPGILAFANNPPSFGQSPRDKPVQFVLQTSGTYEDLDKAVEAMLAEARRNPGLGNVDSDLKLNKPQLEVELRRDKVADSGVSTDTVGRTLETLLGGRQVTRFTQNGEQYDVIVQVADDDRRTPEDLNAIYVRGAGGQMIQLSNLIDMRETIAPSSLNRFNQLRSATVEAVLQPGYSLGEALTSLEEAAERVLPSDMRTDTNGQSREFKQAGSSLYFVFILALAFIFLVLAAQFESFIDPLIIMVSVPLSMTGALAALYLTGGTLNVYSQIGLITLIGLITKHGILIVEFANQRQLAGLPKRQAVIEAAVLRLRPILMTTGAMVLGAVPLALAHGAGAESRQQIGWVIIGGMTLGTILTLFVVPAVYLLMARVRRQEAEEGSGPAHPLPAE